MQRPPAPPPHIASIENGISMSDGVSNGKWKNGEKEHYVNYWTRAPSSEFKLNVMLYVSAGRRVVATHAFSVPIPVFPFLIFHFSNLRQHTEIHHTDQPKMNKIQVNIPFLKFAYYLSKDFTLYRYDKEQT